ncbi:MAG: sigma 54-interacting transcriptional regulator [Desulfobulbales bacterium]|nr:sigma 54-interacting transcriptional regulator [Desulfobulbales bacterium]
MPYLIVEKANRNHKIFKFHSEIKIGRGGDNDIILCDHDDSPVSRNHMYISKKRGGYLLRDTSSNGTFIDGKPVKECLLADGIRFDINNYRFTFVANPGNRDEEERSAGEKGGATEEASRNDGKTIFTSTPQQTFEEKFKLKRQLKEDGVIVENDNMLTLFMDLKEIIKINVPLLLIGESGTGKELVSRILHELSNSAGEFMPLSCSALPAGIFERELFGNGKEGSPDNATLFLDEIDEMSLTLQDKLLGFLEEHRKRNTGLRLIAATGHDLKALVESGQFRRDLYQRLTWITLNIPPLRERKEDIIPLADFFLNRYAREYDVAVKKLSGEAERMLISYEWPGNIGELKNVLLDAALRSSRSVLGEADLSLAPEDEGAETMRIHLDQVWSIEEMEKRQIVKALDQMNGVKLKAAKVLGISRDTLYKKIKKYRIKTASSDR